MSSSLKAGRAARDRTGARTRSATGSRAPQADRVVAGVRRLDPRQRRRDVGHGRAVGRQRLDLGRCSSTIARAALSRRARSAAWFAAGTVSTSATSATIASGHQILALTSSSVNLSNTETCAPRCTDAANDTAAFGSCEQPKGLAERPNPPRRSPRPRRPARPRASRCGSRHLRARRGRPPAPANDATSPPTSAAGTRLPVEVQPHAGRRLHRGRDPVAQQRRGGQQDPVD